VGLRQIPIPLPIAMATRKHLLNIGLCLALIWGIYDAIMGPDLVSDLRDFTGRYGAYLLLISLLFTPLSQRWNWVKRNVSMRRNVGVWGFIYATVHVLIWITLEFYYDWALMLDEISGNLFILLGILAFILLTPLAVTSNHRALKRLGYRKWQMLHTFTYIAVPAVIAHHFMAQKSDTLEPLLMGFVLVLVLVWRYRHAR
jgi:sulfoxide reductase heme-binding subunit YedZ